MEKKIQYSDAEIARIQAEAMEFSGIGIYRYRFDGRLTYIDRGTIRLLDLQDVYPDPAVLVGRKMSELMDYVRPVGTFREIVKGGGSLRNLEYPYRTLSGKLRWVLHDSYTVHDPDCGEDVIQIIVKDITSLKMLSDERDKLAAILETTSDLVSAATPDKRINYMNRAGRLLLRLAPDEALEGLRIEEIHTPESFDLISRVGIPSAIRCGTWRGQTEVISRTGERIPVSQVILSHHDNNGQLVYISTIMRDIREQVAAEKMKSLGMLAGGVAHDLNNVLGPMVALPDLVSHHVKRLGNPACHDLREALESLAVIKDSAMKAAAIVSDLVVMGRRGQLQKVAVDVNRVVAGLVVSKPIAAMREFRPGVRIGTRLAEGPAVCLAADTQLVRILVNLIGNAVESIAEQGDVEVRTAMRFLAEPYHGYETVPAGDYVLIEVADNGCGMDESIMARIFEPFYSTKTPGERSGSGLGLFVVYGLVRDHDGYLDVMSVPGKGTTFRIFLPACGQAEDPTPSLQMVAAGNRERILVVDDDPSQLFLARKILARCGYEATVLSSGAEAARLFENAKRSGEPSPFAVVITDMIMEGVDGMALCRMILSLYPAQKLIIASGYSCEEQARSVKAMGALWLVKPYVANELAAALHARLNTTA